MGSTTLPKGQRITSPEGDGEVIEVIGDKTVIRLDNGHMRTFASEDIVDNSSAG